VIYYDNKNEGITRISVRKKTYLEFTIFFCWFIKGAFGEFRLISNAFNRSINEKCSNILRFADDSVPIATMLECLNKDAKKICFNINIGKKIIKITRDEQIKIILNDYKIGEIKEYIYLVHLWSLEFQMSEIKIQTGLTNFR
jgi:hypothetical protein